MRPGAELTLAAAAPAWLKTREPDPNAPPGIRERKVKRHADNRQHIERHILPAFGHLNLPHVTPDAVKAFMKRLEATPTGRPGEQNARTDEAGNPLPKRMLRPSSIRNIVTTLRKMLGDLGYPIRVSVKVPRSGYDWIRTDGEVVRVLDACGEG